MKKSMRIILIAGLMLIMAFSMAGCGSKSYEITVGDIGTYEMTEVPSGITASLKDNVITVTVEDDGDYHFVVTGEDQKEYAFTFSYKDGNATVEAESDFMSLKLGTK